MTDGLPSQLRQIPISLIQAELARRAEEQDGSTCGSVARGSYNTPLHVFALILILILSTFGKL
jgi:solute carrier family 39 (zinc transporter), member 1/2/3